MKIIYFGSDYAYDALLSLVEAGHDLAAIYSFPCDNIFGFNARLQALAENMEIPYAEKPPSRDELEALAKGEEADLILSLGYAYKIPVLTGDIYSVNIHPSVLPKARGLMPLPHIIMNEPDAAGITAHKLVEEIDAGDVLQQVPLPLIEGETIETLSSRIAMHMPEFLGRLIGNLPELWNKAKPQDRTAKTVAPVPDQEARHIKWTDTVADTMARVRAFGRMGVLFTLNEELWLASRVSGWQEKHDQESGALSYLSASDIVVAVSDGFVCISEAEPLAQA